MSELNKDLNELKKEFQESQNKQAEFNSRILDLLTQLTSSKVEAQTSRPEEIKHEVVKKTYTNLKQPHADEMIQVQSMTKGTLSLNVGGKPKLVFERYGMIKPALYGDLVNIVNENRSFAEEGSFYILDDRAVYHLGLASAYNNLLSPDDVENIEEYSYEQIQTLLANLTEKQKYMLVRVLTDRIYNNERVDHNKIEAISKACGVDINSKVREMREIANSMS